MVERKAKQRWAAAREDQIASSPACLRIYANTKRESGRKAQLGNIAAAKAVADIIRTTLGPRSMLKMLLDATGGIVLTNDGNAILREIDVIHPAAKSMIELSRTQDEEVGDGTTSVIILAGEMLHVAEPFLEKGFHPTVICRAYTKALDDAIAVIDKVAFKIDVNNRKQMLSILQSCISTKFTTRFGSLMAELALDAVTTVAVEVGGRKEIDIKQYAKVEKVPGGRIEDSAVLRGVMFNKDVVAPGKMRRRIENPRVVLLDSPLEYKKGENQTNVELLKEEDWEQLLKMEEEYIAGLCRHIAAFKPDLVITEKGLSDLAAHYLSKAGIAAIRRLRKTDNNRIARAVGATIVNRVEELQESDVGTGAGLFEVRKIGDEFFAFLVECKEPKACTVLLRGASKDILNEMERNLQVRRDLLKPAGEEGSAGEREGEMGWGGVIWCRCRKVRGAQAKVCTVLAKVCTVLAKVCTVLAKVCSVLAKVCTVLAKVCTVLAKVCTVLAKVCTVLAKVCSVLPRGASKDILNEMEQNLQLWRGVARHVWGKASSMAVFVCPCCPELVGRPTPPHPTPPHSLPCSLCCLYPSRVPSPQDAMGVARNVVVDSRTPHTTTIHHFTPHRTSPCSQSCLYPSQVPSPQDAMGVACNVVVDPRLVPRGKGGRGTCFCSCTHNTPPTPPLTTTPRHTTSHRTTPNHPHSLLPLHTPQDAMGVARNVVVDPRLVPGGGAVEMTVSAALKDKASTVAGIEQVRGHDTSRLCSPPPPIYSPLCSPPPPIYSPLCSPPPPICSPLCSPHQWPYRAVASAFEVIPRTLAQNCGVSVIRTVTALQAKVGGRARWAAGQGGRQAKVGGRPRWAAGQGGRQGKVGGRARWAAGQGGRQGKVGSRARWAAGQGGRQGKVGGRARWAAGQGGRQGKVGGRARWAAGQGEGVMRAAGLAHRLFLYPNPHIAADTFVVIPMCVICPRRWCDMHASPCFPVAVRCTPSSSPHTPSSSPHTPSSSPHTPSSSPHTPSSSPHTPSSSPHTLPPLLTHFLLSAHTFLLSSHTFILSSHTFLLSSHTFLLSSHTFLLSSHTFFLTCSPLPCIPLIELRPPCLFAAPLPPCPPVPLPPCPPAPHPGQVWEPYAVKVQTVKTAIEALCLTCSTPQCIPLTTLPPNLPGVGAVRREGADGEDGNRPTAIEAACMLLLRIDDIVSGLKKKQAGGMCAVQTVKTAIEAACMLLRIDDIVSGLKKKQAGGAPGGGKPQMDTGDDVDSEQMLAE
ncbi:unnamed protein product [Closterium sp. NIES-53]